MSTFIQNIQVIEVDINHKKQFMLLAQFQEDYCSDLLMKKNQFELPSNFEKLTTSRKAEFLAGRHLADCALKKLGNSLSQILLHKKGYPIWPTGFSGSISHKHSDVVTWVIEQNNVAVGIDIEHWLQEERAQLIYKKILTPQEYTPPESLSFAEWVTFIFSAKEAFYKALNPVTNKFFGFQDAAIIQLDWQQNTYQIQLNKTLNQEHTEGTIYNGKIHPLKHGLITYQFIQ